ncbi:MAG: translocation/assembly module TamB domain-containing protein, partial [Terriglobales bacterium]
NPLWTEAQIRDLPLAALEQALGQPLPVSGMLEAKISVRGTPRAPTGQGSISVRPARLELEKTHEDLQYATINFHAANGAIRATLKARAPAGEIHGTGSYDPARREYAAELHADDLRMERLQSLAALKIPVRGAISINAEGRGTLDRPEFQFTLAAAKLEIQDQAMTGLTMQATLDNDVVRAQLRATALQAAMHGEARVTLRGGFEASGQLDAPRVPLVPILAAFAHGMAADVSGETAVHASLEGPLREPQQLRASIELPTLRLNYSKALELAATEPVRLDLGGRVLTLHPAQFRGSGTDLQIHGEVPLEPTAPMGMEMQGTVDLRLLHAFAPSLTSAGQARLDVRASGPIAAPTLSGEIQLSGVNASGQGWPASLQNGNGQLRVSGGRLEIGRFTGNVGGGTLTLSGGMALQPAVRFNVAMALRDVRAQYPPTLRNAVSADLTLAGTPNAARLDGQVRLESSSVTPQFDFATFIAGLTAPGGPMPTGFAQELTLNLAITTPNQINISSRDFSLQGGATLMVRGTAAEPRVLGRIDLTGGDLIFRGNRYVLQAATLSFFNPNQTVPEVNLTASTTIQEYDLHLRFQGPADNLRSTYTSDPPLPPADIISLLALGRTREATAAGPAPGHLGAENLIASTVTSQITDRVQRIAGISQLSVDPLLGGSQQQAGARITVQQRVTANLFVTITGDLSSSQRNVIGIQYRLSPRVAVSGVFNQNGGAGVNAKIRKVW